MSETNETASGGCLCGALRWRATAAPQYQGLCFCGDCRKASGGGSVGFMSYPADVLSFKGESVTYASKSFRGTEAVRNFCSVCGGLVFGGIVGQDTSHTIYAGSLDDAARFQPTIAIFGRDRPAWAPVPEGVRVFETMPG